MLVTRAEKSYVGVQQEKRRGHRNGWRRRRRLQQLQFLQLQHLRALKKGDRNRFTKRIGKKKGDRHLFQNAKKEPVPFF
jgi:hypothetical protein